MSKHINECVIPYDVKGLITSAKSHLFKFIVKAVICVVLLVLSILAIIFYGTHLLVFILGSITACASALLLGRLIKNFAFADYSSASGEIANVHKEVKIVHTTKVGGINLFGVRKYDQDGKYEIRLAIFIKGEKRVNGYFLNDLTEEHARYYETKGQAIHIWGTRFPVKAVIGAEKWLCPVCGEFNKGDENNCVRCKRKVLK